MTTEQTKHLDDLLDHLNEFWITAVRLAKRLMDNGEFWLGRTLLANSRLHDQSKFLGVEWDCLVMAERPELLKTAVEQHNRSNAHHPEYWGSIHSMDDVHIAEMVCDWRSRATKFGTGLKDWIHQQAMERFGFTKNDPVYGKIMRFVAMILDEPYQRLS